MTGHPIPASLADRTQRQSFAQSALVAGSLLLLAAMLGGWLFDVGQTLMMTNKEGIAKDTDIDVETRRQRLAQDLGRLLAKAWLRRKRQSAEDDRIGHKNNVSDAKKDRK